MRGLVGQMLPAPVGTGWVFSPPDTHAMVCTVDAALQVWRHQPEKWHCLMLNGMTADLGWDRAAKTYEETFLNVLSQAPARPW
jgi:starch synthase